MEELNDNFPQRVNKLVNNGCVDGTDGSDVLLDEQSNYVPRLPPILYTLAFEIVNVPLSTVERNCSPLPMTSQYILQ